MVGWLGGWWLAVDGLWLLVVGCWLWGCWFLVVDCWLLVACSLVGGGGGGCGCRCRFVCFVLLATPLVLSVCLLLFFLAVLAPTRKIFVLAGKIPIGNARNTGTVRNIFRRGKNAFPRCTIFFVRPEKKYCPQT